MSDVWKSPGRSLLPLCFTREGFPCLLRAFANEVSAQSGKAIPADKAALLIALSQAL